MARAIRGACRASHQLGAISLSCDDSDHCVLPEGSAPDTCAVASDGRTQEKREIGRASLRPTRGLYG